MSFGRLAGGAAVSVLVMVHLNYLHVQVCHVLIIRCLVAITFLRLLGNYDVMMR